MVPQGQTSNVCDCCFVQKVNFHFKERRFGVLILMYFRKTNKNPLLWFRYIF